MYQSLSILAARVLSIAHFSWASPLKHMPADCLIDRALESACITVSDVAALTSRSNAIEMVPGEQLATRGGLNKVTAGMLDSANLDVAVTTDAPWSSSVRVAQPRMAGSESDVLAKDQLLPSRQSSSHLLNLSKQRATNYHVEDREWPPLQPAQQGNHVAHRMASTHIKSTGNEQPSQQHRDFKQAQSVPRFWDQRGKAPKAQAAALNLALSEQRVSKGTAPFIPKPRLDQPTSRAFEKLDDAGTHKLNLSESKFLVPANTKLGQDALKVKANDHEGARPQMELSVLALNIFDTAELQHATELFRQGRIMPTAYVAALEKERGIREELGLYQRGFTQKEYDRRLSEQKARPDKQGMNGEETRAFETLVAEKLTRKNEYYIEYLNKRIKAVLEGRLVPDRRAQSVPSASTSSGT